MNLTINGEKRSVESPERLLTLTKLIELLGHNPSLIVVEFNGAILPPNQWTSQEIMDGDSLEIVTIVGGGY